jgi:hypothetical protein
VTGDPPSLDELRDHTILANLIAVCRATSLAAVRAWTDSNILQAQAYEANEIYIAASKVRSEAFEDLRRFLSRPPDGAP